MNAETERWLAGTAAKDKLHNGAVLRLRLMGVCPHFCKSLIRLRSTYLQVPDTAQVDETKRP